MLHKLKHFSQRLNNMNEVIVGLLMGLLILDVWVGVLDRYLIHWQLAWVEEMARYIMIWAILLAVPCAVCSRAHIGLDLLTRKLNPTGQRLALFIGDLAMAGFFLYIAYSGVTFAGKGLTQLSTVFGMPMALPYAAVPIAFSLAALQTIILMLPNNSQDELEGAQYYVDSDSCTRPSFTRHPSRYCIGCWWPYRHGSNRRRNIYASCA